MRYDFAELPGDRSTLVRPVVPVQIEDFAGAPQLCLVDTGSTANRFSRWIADAIGIELDGPTERVVLGGVHATAWHARVDLSVANTRYDAPATFCDPWPFAFGLLGQEGFLRFFRVTLCAKELWLDVEPEGP